MTLGLLHGAAPDLLVLCHQAGRTVIHEYEDTPVPSLNAARAMYETAAAWLKPAPVVCVALNTYGMPEDGRRARRSPQAEAETGLPTSDPVRFGAGVLVEALVARAARWRRSDEAARRAARSDAGHPVPHRARRAARRAATCCVRLEHDGLMGLGEAAPSAFYGEKRESVLMALELLRRPPGRRPRARSRIS